jgi:hypothetical protein
MNKLVFLMVLGMLLMGMSFALAAQVNANKQTGNESALSISSASNNTEIREIKPIREHTELKIENKNITIKPLTDEQKEIIAEKINAKTGLNLTSEDIDNKTILRAMMSNGKNAEIKIMPNTASETALNRLRLKVCNETNNCTIQLKEVGIGNKTKIAYEIRKEEKSKVLFLFPNKKVMTAQVDAETGEIIPGSVHKPWWSFLARTEK